MSLCVRWFIVLSFVGLAVLVFVRTARAQLPAGTNWALTFADEFNGTLLDSMKWSNGHPWDPASSDPSNVTVSGGVLNLSALRVNSSTFTGAGVSTRPPSGSDLFDMTYGYVEASIKMPSLPGSWPAFWMLENGWPPELDIVEFPVFVSSPSLYNYSDNIHYTNSSGNPASLGNGVHYAGVGDLSQGFHNYGMQWTPTSVTFYIDGIVQSTITDPTAIANLAKSGGGPMYLLLDNSGGGSWPGVPSEAQWPDGTKSIVQVDWVRVWKDTNGTVSSLVWKNAAANGVGSWTDPSVWSTGTTPQLSSQTVIFGANAVNANQTVTWNNSQTVGNLTFTSTTNYTIGSAVGSLLLASTSGTSLVDATGASGNGTNRLNSRLELYNNVTMQTSSKPLFVGGNIIGTGNLTIAAGPVTLTGSSSYTGATLVNGGTLTVTGAITTGSGGAVTIGAATGSAVLNLSGVLNVNNSAAPSLQVGAVSGSTGTININGGTLNTNNELWLSTTHGATGVMNMSGGMSTIGSWLAVGRGGNGGALNVRGGLLSVASNNLTIGAFAGNAGTVNVSGGTVHSVNAIYDGESGSGNMTLSGSGVVNATSLFIGLNSGANGTYTQTGGLLTANGTAYNATNGVGVVVGSAAGSSGTLNISGGTINGSGPLMIWSGTGSVTVSQTGSTPTLVNPSWITLGQWSGGVGTFVQNGGAVATQNDQLYLGYGSGARGNYSLHGGSLEVNDIRTDFGSGTMLQDGGSATVRQWLRLGINSGGSGSYTLAGGSLSVNGAGANVGENGSGTLTIGGSNDGTMVVSPNTSLTVANGTGSGTLNLQTGGLLRTPNIVAGNGTAAFNWSGGTLQNTPSGNLTVSLPVNLSGPGTLAVDVGQTAILTSNAVLHGVGGLTKKGSGTLIVQSTNTYTGSTVIGGGLLQLGNGTANGSIDHTRNLSIAAGAVVNYDLASIDTAGYAISGSGSLAVTGGTLVLSGTNTYKGGTFVTAGRLIVASNTALPDGTSLTVGAGGTLVFDPSMAGGSAIVPSAASPNAVPEPGTLALLIAGAALLAMYCKRR